MSPASLSTAGVLLITVPTIAFGGVSLLSFLMRDIPGEDHGTGLGSWVGGVAPTEPGTEA